MKYTLTTQINVTLKKINILKQIKLGKIKKCINKREYFLFKLKKKIKK